MKKYIFLGFLPLVIILLFGFVFNSQNITQNNYKKVKIYISSASDIQDLLNKGISADEHWGNVKDGIILEMSNDEFAKLKTLGYRYEVLVDDLNEHYNNRKPLTLAEMQNSKELMQIDNITTYTLGTMGGFHKYSEVISVLDTLRALFPNLISLKQNLGTSWESRTIWAVKISDNPDVDESATEPGIYFDGLHHAREPMSMEVQLYYMYWLCENYATNPEAAYLVNNREIFFVPIVNVDGYVYNQTTNPNGGGDWRKNRRNNGTSYGVDLNRNYSYGWGYNSGSSGDPNSDTYRGPSAFSEPESSAIRDFLLLKHPKIGISLHSVAGTILNPYSYCDTVIKYEVYQDYSSEFGPTNMYLYGTVKEMLAYYSSGTTRDYMHVTGTYGWTVEISGSDFWPASSEIIPLNNLNLPMMKYISWVGGAYPKMQNFNIPGKGWAGKNDTLQLGIAVRNKGVSQTSKNVVVELSSTYANATALVNSVNYDSISVNQIKTNNSNPFKFKISSSAVIGDNMQFVCTIKQEGVIASKDTFYITVGKIDSLFYDGGENGWTNWTRSGTGKQWDTTFVSFWKGSKSFADSRYGNSSNSSANYFSLTPSFNLLNRINPRLEFAVKYATEPGYDYARIQISSNNGTSWTNLSGRYTATISGQPSYAGLKYWVYEQINLNTYIGQTVKFRFYYYTDNGTPGDGIYIDDFRIVDYKDNTNGITQIGNVLPDKYSLYQNYPNPFNPVTKIKFDIPANSVGQTFLSVYDILGREVEILVHEKLQPGTYEVTFNASKLPSGTYFYKLSAGDFNDIKKLVMIK